MKVTKYFSAGFRKYIKNTLWLAAEKFLSIIVALVVTVWIARYLGPTQFGQLSFAQSVAGLIASLAPLGLTPILERDLVSKSSDRSKILSTASVLLLFGASLAYLLIICFLSLRNYEVITNELILILGLGAFFMLSRIYTAYFYSQVQAKIIAISTVFSLVISNAIKVVLILIEAPLITFAIALLLDSAILLPILLLKIRSSKVELKISLFSKQSAKSLLKDSWPYLVAGFLATIYMRIDTIMIKEMLDDYSAGQYAAAARLSQGLYYLPVTLLASIYPAIVNAKNHSEIVYVDRLSSLYSFLFFSAVAISVLVSIFNEFIISTLYGEQYSMASKVLLIHVWSSVFVFIGACSGRWLLTENLQIIAATTTLIGAISNISLNLYLIPKHGIEGAAWASLIAYSLSGYLSLLFWSKTRSTFFIISKSITTLPNLKW